MITVSGIKLPLGSGEYEAVTRAKKLLGHPQGGSWHMRRMSYDLRRGSAMQVCSVVAEFDDAEYEQKLADASAKGEEIIRSATARAHKQEEEIIREANETAAKNLRRADEQIEMEKKKALNQLKDEVSTMAVDIASAVIEKNLSEEDNREIVDRFIGQLGDGT